MRKLKQYIIRNYNLLFKKDKCVKIKFDKLAFTYGYILHDGYNNLMCLGNNWFKLIK